MQVARGWGGQEASRAWPPLAMAEAERKEGEEGVRGDLWVSMVNDQKIQPMGGGDRAGAGGRRAGVGALGNRRGSKCFSVSFCLLLKGAGSISSWV